MKLSHVLLVLTSTISQTFLVVPHPVRPQTKSGMSFRNPLSETGFEPNESFPDWKLVAEHYDEVNVEFREYEPMKSSNKRWSKDELMPKKVSA